MCVCVCVGGGGEHVSLCWVRCALHASSCPPPPPQGDTVSFDTKQYVEKAVAKAKKVMVLLDSDHSENHVLVGHSENHVLVGQPA